MVARFLLCSTIPSLLAAVSLFGGNAADAPRPQGRVIAASSSAPSPYYWKARPVANSAQLLTLFLHSQSAPNEDVPVMSILRDTLGDKTADNDRLTSVWLLSHSSITPWQRMFGAVPFLYWRIGDGGVGNSSKTIKPFVDLSASQGPSIYGVGRNILQWTAFDPLTTPVRATTRAYQSNIQGDERIHLEEAIGYLRHAPPAGTPGALSQSEIDSVIARLELRKQLLGGFVSRRSIERVGKEARFDEERERSRNWELLRQLAERTGLYFEPLQLTGTSRDYAMLWFSPQGSEPTGFAHKSLWKILNIRDPWTDARLKTWKGITVTRAVDRDGSLLPAGESGERDVTLIPLGAYSMDYPRMPLLLVDFRDSVHIRRHEMTQRAIAEVTSGVIGISHFTNWYFYVAADAYDFVASRHGGAVDLQQRLDSYARFRVVLQLDSNLDTPLRAQMQRLVNAMAVNPLESSPEREIKTAESRYQALQLEAEDGRLALMLDKRRRSELAGFGKSRRELTQQALLHIFSLGLYTDRAPRGPENAALLNDQRRLETSLAFLEKVNRDGTPPEVAYDRTRLQLALYRVSSSPASQATPLIQARTEQAIQRFRSLTGDPVLLEDCRVALNRNKPSQADMEALASPRPFSGLPQSGK